MNLSMRTYSILATTVCGLYLSFRNTALSAQIRAFFTSKWRYLYWMFGENDFYFCLFGSYSMLVLLFVFVNIFFTYVDLTGKPNWIKNYKVQPNKNETIDIKTYLKTLRLSAFNVIVVYFIVSVTFSPIVIWYAKVPCISERLPTVPQFIFHFLVSVLLEEIAFYYIHRTLHHPFFYSRIHKIHHEWKAPISITHVYCHPVEQYCLNTLPGILGTVLLGDNFGNHLISLFIWLAILKVSSAIVHSGYHIPFMVSPEEHDFHHGRFNQNFGTIGLLDYIHGTSTAFLENVAHKRHFVLIGLSSAREIVPDR